MHLKYSKGSAHELHRYSALQAVEPNWLITSVFSEPHLGQVIVLGLEAKSVPLSALPFTGGAMP